MARTVNNSDNGNNKWYQSVWLPFAAATYIVICIFDFMIMPVYVTAHNSRIENAVLTSLESKDAAAFADGLIKANQAQRQWNPLTLLGAGMFHLAFGALLTGGAVTRGFAKKSEIEGYYRYGEGSQSDYTPYDRPQQYNYNRGSQGYEQSTRYGRNDPGRAPPGQQDDYNSGPMPKTPVDDEDRG